MSIPIGGTDDAFDYGTLLWIGNRNELAFRDAYQFSESEVSQLAYRADFDDASRRVATDVRMIICCLVNDAGVDLSLFRSIRASYSDADVFLLLGPLCAGARPSAPQRFDADGIAWHEWESRLPQFLRRCGAERSVDPSPRSIAVVSSSYSNASALLSIAASGGATTAWCRPAECGKLGRFDELWCDDSLPSHGNWDECMGRLRRHADRIVWISNFLTPDSKLAATSAGVDLVIARPGDYSRLIDRVTPQPMRRERQAA